jgi:hypothetical protein
MRAGGNLGEDHHTGSRAGPTGRVVDAAQHESSAKRFGNCDQMLGLGGLIYMTRLCKVENGQLTEVATASPNESIVEAWIEKDPSILGLDLLVIARQFTTDFGGRIDLLGIDQEGDLTLIEMKRDRTPREVIAQTLDYGSWIKGLTTPRIHSIANAYLKRPLSEAFLRRFDQNIPETLNSSHTF